MYIAPDHHGRGIAAGWSVAGLTRRGEDTSQQRSSRVIRSSRMQVLGHVSAGKLEGKRLLKASPAPSAGEICHGFHPALQCGNLHLGRYAVQAGNRRP